MLSIAPSVQSPRAYDLQNLQQQQLGERIFPATDAEIDAEVTPADYTVRPGFVSRYASLADAIAQAQQPAGRAIRIDMTVAIDADTTIPVGTRLFMTEGGAFEIAATARLTINARFFPGPLSQLFICEPHLTTPGRVAFGTGVIEALRPEWFGAIADGAFDIDGNVVGTDSTVAMDDCIRASTDAADGDVAVHEIRLCSGNYIVGNLVFPPATRLRGRGRALTNFLAPEGLTGAWFTDNGSAAKIVMEGFAMYGNNEPGIDYGLRLGYNGVQHGVEGYCRDLWIRDIPKVGSVCFDVNGNVAFYDLIAAYSTDTGIRITGIANHASKMVAYGCAARGADLNLCTVDGLEIEAPGNTCVPLYFTGNAAVRGLIIALANDTVISHLWELTANATTWEITQFCLAFGNTPSGITVSNGNGKRADGSYFGGNATAGSRDGEGHYTSATDGQEAQSFTVRIINSSGTLQHWIRDASNVSAAGALGSIIKGASSALTNTPTGTDSATAFAAGLKIGSATNSLIIFDTPAQKVAASRFVPVIVGNSTGTALTALCSHQSINVNGVAKVRFTIQLLNATTAVGFGINTANIADGKLVQIVFQGYLSR